MPVVAPVPGGGALPALPMSSRPATLALRVLTQPTTSRSDRDLIAACADGQIEALGELFDRHHGRVRGFVTRLIGRRTEVDDLVQATFLEVMTSAGRFRGDAQSTTWLIGIALNLARGQLRATRRTVSDAAAHEVADERPDPREAAARRQVIERLEPALAGLPAMLREVFVLCDLEQVRGVDAARLLGVPEGTVARRLHDARARLREAIAGGSR